MAGNKAKVTAAIAGPDSVGSGHHMDMHLVVEGTGSPVGAVTPKFIHQFYWDTAGNNLWWAFGVAAANWKQISN